jgi:predicted transcriptional regulator
MSDVAKPTELLPLVTDIVAAHLSNNNVPSAELPQLIREVYHALAMASTGGPAPAARPEPAVSVKKSVTPDYIVCLEDGKKLKMLKRHLRTSYGLTPEEYRQKWSLPADYPMVAPNYAAQRSAFAKKIGLGRTGGKRKGRGRR